MKNISQSTSVPAAEAVVSKDSNPNHLTTSTSLDAQVISKDQVTSLQDQGRQAELRGDVVSAVQYYSDCLRLLQTAKTACSVSGAGSDSQQHLEEQLEKPQDIQKEVSARLASLQSGAGNSKESQARNRKQLEDDGGSDHPDAPTLNMTRATEMLHQAQCIFSLEDGVTLLYISDESISPAKDQHLTLGIFKFDRELRKSLTGTVLPPAFLQVGSWVYPLLPGLSPVLVTSYGAYIFPDIISDNSDRAVAVMLSNTVPNSERVRFEGILSHFTMYRRSNDDMEHSPDFELTEISKVPEEATSTLKVVRIISMFISVVTWLTSWMIMTCTLVLIWLLRTVFQLVQARIQPASQPTRVDPMVQQGVAYMKTATTVTVQVTHFVIDKLGEGIVVLAKKLAPIIRQQGEKVLPEYLMANSEIVKGTMEITATSVKGIATVYESLDHASKTLKKNLAEESFQLIHHAYGEEVGNLVSDTVDVVNCIIATANTPTSLKVFAQKAGQHKGKAAVLQGQSRKTAKRRSTLYHPSLVPSHFVQANTRVHDRVGHFINLLDFFEKRQANGGQVLRKDAANSRKVPVANMKTKEARFDASSSAAQPFPRRVSKSRDMPHRNSLSGKANLFSGNERRIKEVAKLEDHLKSLTATVKRRATLTTSDVGHSQGSIKVKDVSSSGTEEVTSINFETKKPKTEVRFVENSNESFQQPEEDAGAKEQTSTSRIQHSYNRMSLSREMSHRKSLSGKTLLLLSGSEYRQRQVAALEDHCKGVISAARRRATLVPSDSTASQGTTTREDVSGEEVSNPGNDEAES